MHADHHVVILPSSSGELDRIYLATGATPSQRHKLNELEQRCDEQHDWRPLRDYVKQLRIEEYQPEGFFEYGHAPVETYVHNIWTAVCTGFAVLVRCESRSHADRLFDPVLEKIRWDGALVIDSHSKGLLQILGRNFGGSPFSIRLTVDTPIPETSYTKEQP